MKLGQRHKHSQDAPSTHTSIVTPTVCTHMQQHRRSALSCGCALPPLYSHFLACFMETHPLCFVGQDTHTHTHRQRGVCTVTLSLSGHSESQELPLEAAAQLEDGVKEGDSTVMRGWIIVARSFLSQMLVMRET